MAKIPFYGLFLFSILFFIFLPLNILLAAGNIEKILNDPDKVELKREETVRLEMSLIKKVKDEWIYSVSAENSKPEEQAILNLLAGGAKNDVFNYLSTEKLKELIIEIVKIAYRLSKIVITQDLSQVLDEIEKRTVEAAKKYITEWLFENKTKVATGNLSLIYPSIKGEFEQMTLPYILILNKKDEKEAYVSFNFYSSKVVDAPTTSSSYQWEGGIEKLEKFIVRINGIVLRQDDGVYHWTEGPEFEFVFDEPVPEFDFKKPGLVDKINNYLDEKRAALNSAAAKIGNVAIKVTNNTKDNAQKFLDKIKSFFKNINIFQASISSDLSISTGPEINFSNIDIDKINSAATKDTSSLTEVIKKDIELGKKIEEGIRGAEQGKPEEEALSLEEIADVLDDVAEKIDILSVEIAKLTGKSSDSGEKTTVLSEKDEEEDSSVDLALEEEENTEEQGDTVQTITTTIRHSSGGGGSSRTTPPVVYCKKGESDAPTRDKVILNEIAWAGTNNSVNDEWFELKNIGTRDADISGWQVIDKNEQITIVFPEKSVIPSAGFYLLERTNDDSVPIATADLIYTGVLNDKDEALRLFNKECQIQDETLATPDWPSGDKIEKRTMERASDLSWYSYSGEGVSNIMGTPKAENSQPQLIIPPYTGQDKTPPNVLFNFEPIQRTTSFKIAFELIDALPLDGNDTATPSGVAGFYFRWKKDGVDWIEDDYKQVEGAPLNYQEEKTLEGEDSQEYYFQIKAKDIAGNESIWLTDTPSSLMITVPKNILINEVQIDNEEGPGGADNDWVELYNPNDFEISLDGWSIQKHSKDEPCSADRSFYKKNFSNDNVILGRGFFLVVDTQAEEDLKNMADMTIGWSLSEDNTVYLMNITEAVSESNFSTIIDRVAFGENSCFAETSSALSPPEEKSIERKELGRDTNNNSDDFGIKDFPTPTNSKGEIITLGLPGEPLWQSFQANGQFTGRGVLPGPAFSGTATPDIFISGESPSDTFGFPVVDSKGIVYLGARITKAGATRAGIFAFRLDGTEKWFYSASLPSGSPVLSEQDKTLYFLSQDGISALKSKTGELKWKKGFRYLFPNQHPLLSKDGRLYFMAGCDLPDAADNSCLISLDKEGNKLWIYSVEQEKLYFDAELPESVETSRSSFVSPIVISTSNIIYFGFKDTLFAINGDGSLKWKKKFESKCEFYDCLPEVASISIADDGTIYPFVRQEDDFRAMMDEGTLNCLHSINPENIETEIWEAKCFNFPGFAPFPISVSGNIYVSSGYMTNFWNEGVSHIQSFNPQGSENWAKSMAELNSGLPIIDSEENFYGFFNNSFLKAFDNQGVEKWFVQVSGFTNGVVMGKGGALLVPAAGKIYIVK